MAISSTSGPAIAALFQAQTRQKESTRSASEGSPQQIEVGNEDEQTPAALQQKLMDMADEMAGVAAQFRSRRELEKKGNLSGENFERVLEEDAVPKAKKLIDVLSIDNGRIDRLMARARGFFPDDSDLYLVLKELLKRKELSRIQRTRLESLLAQVSKTADKKMLLAGINCALKARLFGATLMLKASFLRTTYRRFLQNDMPPVADYEEWIASYGYKERHTVLNFVEESLRIDIQAENPSCDLLEFSNLGAHMLKIRLLRTADQEFVMFLLSAKLVIPHQEEEADWLLLLCRIVRNEISMSQLLSEAFGTACVLQASKKTSVLLNAVRSAYKLLPDALFQNERDPEDAVAAFDRLIDAMYAAELLEQRGITL